MTDLPPDQPEPGSREPGPQAWPPRPAGPPGGPASPGGPGRPPGWGPGPSTGPGGWPPGGSPGWPPTRRGGSSGPGPAGWYSGPVPFSGLVARESIGRSVGRTIAKVSAALATLAIGGIALLVLLGALASGVSGTSASSGLKTRFVAGDEGNGNRLLAIPITGVILGEDEGGGGLFASLVDATYGYTVKEQLEDAAARNDIKGVVLEMDTPGGTIYGSRAIADAVAAYRERTGRPVLAYVRGMSASGGMYAMAGADRIVADHGTLVGSVGVIFGPITHYDGVVATDGGLLGGGVTTTGGITETYITAGRSKDLGNPYRQLTDEELAVLQQGVDNNYASFVDHVATGRGITAGALRDELGALIFDEQTALQHGLIDQVGNRDEAYAAAAELARLDTGNWQVVRVSSGGSGLFGLGALGGGGSGDDGDGSRAATSGATPGADIRRVVCGRGPTMLAYFGELPASCS